jgi:hypothetical protein
MFVPAKAARQHDARAALAFLVLCVFGFVRWCIMETEIRFCNIMLFVAETSGR